MSEYLGKIQVINGFVDADRGFRVPLKTIIGDIPALKIEQELNNNLITFNVIYISIDNTASNVNSRFCTFLVDAVEVFGIDLLGNIYGQVFHVSQIKVGIVDGGDVAGSLSAISGYFNWEVNPHVYTVHINIDDEFTIKVIKDTSPVFTVDLVGNLVCNSFDMTGALSSKITWQMAVWNNVFN